MKYKYNPEGKEFLGDCDMKISQNLIDSILKFNPRANMRGLIDHYQKKMGEYILVKRGKEYGVYDADGNVVADIKYRKVKFERNTLYLQDFNKIWSEIE